MLLSGLLARLADIAGSDAAMLFRDGDGKWFAALGLDGPDALPGMDWVHCSDAQDSPEDALNQLIGMVET
jgi:hypothetical protein